MSGYSASQDITPVQRDWVVAEAVPPNRSPQGKFPGIREFSRELTGKRAFCSVSASSKHLKLRLILYVRRQIPVRSEQGIAGNWRSAMPRRSLARCRPFRVLGPVARGLEP